MSNAVHFHWMQPNDLVLVPQGWCRRKKWLWSYDFLIFFLRPSAINDAKVLVMPLLVLLDTCKRTHTHSFMSHPLRRLFSDTCSVHTTRRVRPFTHKSLSHPQQALLAFCSPPPHRLSPYLPPSLPWCFPPAGRARLAWRFSMGRCWCIVELKQPCRSIM